MGRLSAGTQALVAATVLLLAVSCTGTSGPETADPVTSVDPREATTTTEPTFSGEGSERFCEVAREAREPLAELLAGATSAEGARALVTSAADAVDRAASVAPDEIADAAAILARAYSSLVDRAGSLDWDPEAIGTAIDAELGRPEVRSSLSRLQAYQRTICGLG